MEMIMEAIYILFIPAAVIGYIVASIVGAAWVADKLIPDPFVWPVAITLVFFFLSIPPAIFVAVQS